MKIAIYNENFHEQTEKTVKKIYPDGIHGAIKAGIADDDFVIDTVTLESIDKLTEEYLNSTDVLIWWGHVKHGEVSDEIANRVAQAVNKGMGIIFLHSAHFSKPFKRLMGTACNLTWRENGDRELLWVVNPSHPIAQGLGRFIKIDHEEAYGEPFGIPEPDELVFIGSFQGGEVFRAGCCYRRGMGKIFYFQPGHETYPIYYEKDILKVIKNAVLWAKPIYRTNSLDAPNVQIPLEEIL